MRKINKFLIFGTILLSSGYVFGAEGKSFADQLEVLEWSEPERAVQIVDAAPPLPADSTASEIEMLEIRAMVYANSSRDEDVNTIERRLDAIASAGDASALRAGRFVRAYSARWHGQYAAAEAELKGIDINSVDSDSERYRLG